MIKDIIAIDSHTHINSGSKYDSRPDSKVYTADLLKLQQINKAANIDKMFCSTFSSVISTNEIEKENEYLFNLSRDVKNLYQWVVIDPNNKNTFKQAEKMLDSGKCVGIKLHPLYHEYSVIEHADKLFSFASEHKAIVQIHPEEDADYILPVADKFPDVTFIMAHMGTEGFANAIEYAVNQNVYVDTSGNASTQNYIVEYVVGRVGSEHILFGTDTYAAGFQRGRIEYALIPDKDKENILRNNALRLFKKYL